ncbi:MAG: protein kinase [Polyangiaceae bacterium]
MTKAGRILEGKYRLEQLLGRGGMGSVWRARHLALGQSVAVKLLERRHPDSDEARARFEREARVIARLRTPHVAQVHDQGVDEGTPYMVMEMLEGEDLGARLKARQRLSLREVAAIAGQVARVLRLAHEAGVVHRDLKPSNVFLAHVHDEEIVKVLDFGIAKSDCGGRGLELTVTGALLGTLNYMSPEQLRDPRTVDWRTDLWSLGVVAFYALTGVEPFGGKSFGDTVGRICKDPLPLPSQVAPGMAPELDGFFERAFARDRNERFQSGRELADRLIGLALAATRDQEGVATTLLDTSSSRVVNPWAPRNDPATDSGVLLMPAFPTQATPALGTPASASGPPSAPQPASAAPARVPSSSWPDPASASVHGGAGAAPPSVPPPSADSARRPRLESVPPSFAPMALPARHDSGSPPPKPGFSTTSRRIHLADLQPRAPRRRGAGRWVPLVAAVAGVLGVAVVVRAGLSWRSEGTSNASTRGGGDPTAQAANDHAPSTQPAQSIATPPETSAVPLPLPVPTATAAVQPGPEKKNANVAASGAAARIAPPVQSSPLASGTSPAPSAPATAAPPRRMPEAETPTGAVAPQPTPTTKSLPPSTDDDPAESAASSSRH